MNSFIRSSIVIALLSIFLFSSCKKYVDGPAFSLRSKKNRLCGDWTIGSATINSNDVTAQYQTSITGFNIEKNGTYKITGTVPDEGTWKLGEDKDDAFFTSNTPGVIMKSFRILRLKHKDVWFKQTQPNGDMLIMKLK